MILLEKSNDVCRAHGYTNAACRAHGYTNAAALMLSEVRQWHIQGRVQGERAGETSALPSMGYRGAL